MTFGVELGGRKLRHDADRDRVKDRLVQILLLQTL